MAEKNPFELQPQQPFMWGGMPQITSQEGLPGQEPYGGLQPSEGGSYFTLSPEVMQMMWEPQAQPGLTPQPQPLPPLY